jgi:hypothetical protein
MKAYQSKRTKHPRPDLQEKLLIYLRTKQRSIEVHEKQLEL